MALRPFVLYVYICPVCNRQRHTREDALSCCSVVKEGYSCPECEMLHVSSDAADQCCKQAPGVSVPLGFFHKAHRVLAMRWKGDTDALNTIVGQGAAQFVPDKGVALPNGQFLNKGDWMIRNMTSGKIEVLSDEQFHQDYEPE